jgi:NADH-quinone oxidoreductase subunit G
MDTVTLKIDGRDITVEKGRTILRAALDNGIAIPYYCFHPGLGVDGSCRVCIVKVEKMPKLQTACSTICTDGMIVETASREVIEARASVFEFLLINHPLDCPVCDKGGECPLQDFSYAYGPTASRMEFQRRTFDGEGVKADVDFGPTLMLNRNRCILCTRCVRFMREVDGEAQIGIVNRGNLSQISTFREKGVHSLLSGNLMDVCPVGAITTRDYRFASRPWDNPVVVDTTCTLCEKGCSETAWLKAKPEWAKGARLVRLTPRYNPQVNGYWMCDIGRFQYHFVESDQRLTSALSRNASGVLEPARWVDVMKTLREKVQPAVQAGASGLHFLVSAHASLEELFLLRELTSRLASGGAAPGVSVSWRYEEKAQPKNTKFPVPPVDAPNVSGARDLGLAVPEGASQRANLSHLRTSVEAGDIKALYVFDPGPDGSIGDLSWVLDARSSGKLPLLIVHGVLMTPLAAGADFVLPGSAWIEKDATYTNAQGLVQGTSRVMPPPGEAMEDWQIFVLLSAAFGVPLQYESAVQIRRDLAAALSGKIGYEGLARFSFARALGARTWFQASNPSERWKWDFMFQDLPPVKTFPLMERGALQPESRK